MKIIFFWGLFSVFVILLIAQMITLIPILKKEIAIVFYTYRQKFRGRKMDKKQDKILFIISLLLLAIGGSLSPTNTNLSV